MITLSIHTLKLVIIILVTLIWLYGMYRSWRDNQDDCLGPLAMLAQGGFFTILYLIFWIVYLAFFK
jgi:hypothetical protein